MILAAGSGTRLLPLTGLRPKPLFPVYNVPLLVRILRQLQEGGVTDIVINTHHLKEKIESYIWKESLAGVKVTLSHEPVILGTGGGMKKVESFWDDRPFLVVNGDIVHTIDLDAAYRQHMKSGNMATLVLHDEPRCNQVELDREGAIVGIRKERVRETSSPTRSLAFTGIHILSPAILREIPSDCFVDIIPVYLRLISQGIRVGGYEVEGHYWCDIGTPSDYHRIHRDIHQGKVRLNAPLPAVASSAVGRDTVLEGYVCLGEKTMVGRNCRIRNSILWDGVEIQDNLTIEGCIIGDGAKVKQSLKDQMVVTSS